MSKYFLYAALTLKFKKMSIPTFRCFQNRHPRSHQMERKMDFMVILFDLISWSLLLYQVVEQRVFHNIFLYFEHYMAMMLDNVGSLQLRSPFSNTHFPNAYTLLHRLIIINLLICSRLFKLLWFYKNE